MQTVSADSTVPEPAPENLGTAEGLERSRRNTEALEEFAQNMAENIMQSFLSQMEMVRTAAFSLNQGQEILGEELASAVIEIALREACGRKVEDHTESSESSATVRMDHEKDLQTSGDTQNCHPPLSQSGLPIVGSLDYPDAPPTTPLIPELERSRRSFSRNLKGGLAKVFLPSPPPPTPKDKEDDSDNNDAQVELMEHLMHSLSTDNLAGDTFEVGPQRGASVEAFAEALSGHILDWALSAKNTEQIPDESNVHLLSHRLADTIISSSLDEAKTLV